MMKAIPLFLSILVSTFAIATEFPEPEIVWEYDLGETSIEGTPVFFPSVEAPEGIIALARDGCVVMIDGKGRLVWEHNLGEWGNASPAVGDLDGDGSSEIVTATIAGEVVALNADGFELWRFPLSGKVTDMTAACLADLDGDGACEVLIGDQAGWMNCLSGKGDLIWRIKVDPYQVSAAAFIKDNRPGSPDKIVYGTENDHVVGVSGAGELLWLSRQVGQFGRTNPTVGDLDNDGEYEVAVITSFNNPDSRLWVHDADEGVLQWSGQLNLHGYPGIAIADLEGDGSNEVLVGLRSNTIYCFEADGTERWHTTTGGHAICWAPAVADVNGDGRCEIVFGVRDTNERGKSWFVLDDRGNLLGEYEIPGGANGSPLIGDVDQDGRIDIVLPGSTVGLLRCVTFGGKAEGARMPWVSHRYDAARSGCLPSKADPLPAPLEPALRNLRASWEDTASWGENSLLVKWPTFTTDRAVYETSIVDPQGRRKAYVQDVSPEELPGAVSVALIGKGKHTVGLKVWDGSSPAESLFIWNEEIELGEFGVFSRKQTDVLAALSDTSDKLLGESPSAARLLSERKANRLGLLEQLGKRVNGVDFGQAPQVDDLLEDILEFTDSVSEDLALARTAESVHASHPGLSLAVWEDPNPWDETLSRPEAVALSDRISLDVSLYQGEDESRSLILQNLTPNPLSVQIRPEKETRDCVHFYEVVETPRQDGNWVYDALAELNSSWTFRLAPGEKRPLWLTITAKDLQAGTAELSLEIVALDWTQKPLAVSIHTNVSDLNLNDAPVFRVCNWSSPSRIRADGVDMNALEVAKEHGMNVFTESVPTPRFDSEGNLVGEVDWTQFDTDLEWMEPNGFVLLSGQGVAPPKGTERFGPEHLKAQRTWLQMLAEHLESKGWGKDRWALYPVDEPGLYGGTRIQAFVEVARHLKEAMPDVPLYANPSGFVTCENMADMVPLVDVWAPEQALMRRQPELAPFFLGTGKPVWCYEAPPDVKTLLPLGYYRSLSWMAFRLGLSGVGFWTQFYQGAYYGGNDLWSVGKGVLYGANYVVSGNEVISRRWEAFREGIEDIRAFLMLRDAAEIARAKGVLPEAVAEADRLLEAGIEEATRKPWPCGDPTRFLRDYEMDYERILRMRKEVAELTRMLKEGI